MISILFDENIDKVNDIVNKPENREIKAYINDNKESNIAMVVTWWEKESITVFRENLCFIVI